MSATGRETNTNSTLLKAGVRSAARPAPWRSGGTKSAPTGSTALSAATGKGTGKVIAMDKDLEEIVAEIRACLARYKGDPYSRGMADGAMMVLAYYDPKLFHRLFHDWAEAKKTLVRPGD